jgi:type I restriction enzyme S subunit
MSQKLGLVPISDIEQKTLVSETYAGAKLVEQDDLVLNRLKAHLGVFALATQPGIVSPDYTVLRRTKSLSMRYLEYVLRSAPCRVELRKRTKGIVEGFWRLYTDDFYDIRLPVPPAAEQAAIVRYLDHADVSIGRYIAAKRKLIALLDEHKHAIVRQAVTRGLDPARQSKSSGIDWLGDVPAHWGLRRLRFLAHISTGGRDTVDRRDDGQYPFFVRSQTVERIGTYGFDGEGVLTAGDGAGVAKIFHYVDGKFDFHQRVYLFSDFASILRGRFFFHYLGANLRYEAFRETAKSTVDSLRRPMLANFPVLLPPIEEQDRIVDHIASSTGHIDVALTTTGHDLNLIREYRARLIADVVTGKLDVRDAASRLAEKVDVPASFDSFGGDEELESDDVVDAVVGGAEA